MLWLFNLIARVHRHMHEMEGILKDCRWLNFFSSYFWLLFFCIHVEKYNRNDSRIGTHLALSLSMFPSCACQMYNIYMHRLLCSLVPHYYSLLTFVLRFFVVIPASAFLTCLSCRRFWVPVLLLLLLWLLFVLESHSRVYCSPFLSFDAAHFR